MLALFGIIIISFYSLWKHSEMNVYNWLLMKNKFSYSWKLTVLKREFE